MITNILEVTDNIRETMLSAGHPLTDEQYILLSATLAVWIEKAEENSMYNALEGRYD